MRSVYARVLTAGLLVLLASPAFAQPPGGRGMFQPNAAMLLRDDKVQAELKLTDDQKDQLKKIADKYKGEFEQARKDMDFKKMGELMKSAGEDVDKVVADSFKPDQRKRLNQLLVQREGFIAFSKEDVKSCAEADRQAGKGRPNHSGRIEEGPRGPLQGHRGGPGKAHRGPQEGPGHAERSDG